MAKKILSRRTFIGTAAAGFTAVSIGSNSLSSASGVDSSIPKANMIVAEL